MLSLRSVGIASEASSANARAALDATDRAERMARWKRASVAAAAGALAVIVVGAVRPALAATAAAHAPGERASAEHRSAPRRRADGAQREQGTASRDEPGSPRGAHAKRRHSAAHAVNEEMHAGVAADGGRAARADEAAVQRSAAPMQAKATPRDRQEKKEKRSAARAGLSKRRAVKKGSDKDAPPRPCLGQAVQFERGGLESEHVALLDCRGKPREDARRALSVLARPWGTPRPAHLPEAHEKSAKARPSRGAAAQVEIAPGVRLLDPGVLSRIDALSRRYPGRVVSLVSGYRPQSQGSLHQSARAIDLRIVGVRNEELAAACRALPDTGCGYYPNSSFVHVDVRTAGTGSVTWIDASGPGEPPRYVTVWPPPVDEAPVASAAPPQGVTTEAHDATSADAGEATEPEPARKGGDVEGLPDGQVEAAGVDPGMPREPPTSTAQEPSGAEPRATVAERPASAEPRPGLTDRVSQRPHVSRAAARATVARRR